MKHNKKGLEKDYLIMLIVAGAIIVVALIMFFGWGSFGRGTMNNITSYFGN